MLLHLLTDEKSPFIFYLLLTLTFEKQRIKNVFKKVLPRPALNEPNSDS